MDRRLFTKMFLTGLSSAWILRAGTYPSSAQQISQSSSQPEPSSDQLAEIEKRIKPLYDDNAESLHDDAEFQPLAG